MRTTRTLMKLCALLLVFSLTPTMQALAIDNKPLLGFSREASDREREFYCLCVEAILDERYLIEEALGVRGAPATTR